MIELELTYLVKSIPEGLEKCESMEISDLYIPKEDDHAKLRLRKKGNKYLMTKKVLLNENDASEQKEHTIPLSESEFNALSKLEGRKVRKFRYYYDYNGQTAELDVFQDDLKGLIVVDFEFDSVEAKSAFVMPDFCSDDITQEEFIAGGVICGKSYDDVKDNLDRFSYSPLYLKE